MKSSSAAVSEIQVTPELLAQSAEAWRLCEGTEGASLLRLAILRDLLRSLHSEKSRHLATGRKAEAQQFKYWEQRIENLRQGATLSGELTDLLRENTAPRKKTRLIPQAVLAAMGREKLERYDRKWESELVAEAAALGWKFWTLQAWVSIPLAEDWNRRLGERLWPNGVVLFVESVGQGPAGSPSLGRDAATEPLWKGQWTLLLHPRYRSPEDLSLDFDRWPGAPETSPDRPSWKLLFQSKRS